MPIINVKLKSQVEEKFKKLLNLQCGMDVDEYIKLKDITFREIESTYWNWDSLDYIELVMAAEEEFRIEIEDETLELVDTPHKLQEYILQTLLEKGVTTICQY